MRVILLLLLTAGCASPSQLASPRGECFELRATPSARDFQWFQFMPGVIELTDDVLPDPRAETGPQPFRRARSWPARWSNDEPLADDDPVGGWRRAGWRRGDTRWVDDGDAATDSLVIDIGPYAIAFAGLSYVVRREGDALRGRVLSFTDSIVNGELPYRETAVTGERVRCPATPAHLDRQPYAP